jgi:hypothetical protein
MALHLLPRREKPTLVVGLTYCTVRLELSCPDHEAAIALFDQVIANARRAGVVNLVMQVRPLPEDVDPG